MLKLSMEKRWEFVLLGITCDPGLLLKCPVEIASQNQLIDLNQACGNGNGSLEQAGDCLEINRMTYCSGHENVPLRSPAAGDWYFSCWPSGPCCPPAAHSHHGKGTKVGSFCEMQDSFTDNLISRTFHRLESFLKLCYSLRHFLPNHPSFPLSLYRC